MKPPPPNWGKDKITEFFEMTKENSYATFFKYPKQFSQLVQIDGFFREAIECAQNSKHWFPYLFILKAHSAFLAALELIMGTQAQEAYMVMRGALENALYGYYIFQNPDLAEVYLKRDENEQTKTEMKNKFRNRAIIELLKKDDTKLGSAVEALYERTIDFGAHPNEKSLSASFKKIDLEKAVRFEVSYLTGNPLVIELGMKTAIQIGIACVKLGELILPKRFKIVGLSDKVDELSKGF